MSNLPAAQLTNPQRANWLPLQWGPRSTTDYGLAAVIRRPADEFRGSLGQHIIMCAFTPFTGRETTLASSRIRTVNAPVGACEIIPAHADYWARWHARKEVAFLTLDPLWLNRIAQQELGGSSLELEVDALPFTSDRIHQIASMIHSEFERSIHAPSQLYIDSLLTLLGMDLIRNHTSASGRPEPRPTRLPKKALDRIAQYMQAQLAGEITVEALASLVGYSPSHFLKCFKSETGLSPHKFLINLRLDRAQEMLTHTNEPITEIACKTGFSSQAHLTTSMMKVRSVTPAQFRRGLILPN